MSELNIPESWAEIPIGKLSINKNGQASKFSEVPKGATCLVELEDIEKDSGEINFDREIPKSFSTKNIFIEHDVLYGKLRPYLNKCGIAKKSGVASSEILPITTTPVVPEFVASFLRSPSFLSFAMSKVHGARMPRLSRDHLADYILPLPPIDEQKRIVAKIEATSEKIKAIESAVTQAESLITKYRESLLAKAFRGELVPQDPNDEPASKLLERIRAERANAQDGKKKRKDDLPPIKEEEIPFEIPKSWEWVRLGDVCSRITDGVHQKPHYTSNGVPFISVKDITTGKLDFSDCKFVSKSDHIKFTSRCKAERGDILYTKVGATYGRAALVDTDNEFSIYVSVSLVKPIQSCLDSAYLLHLMNNWIVKHQADKRISGIGVPDLHLVEIKNFLIPIPPLAEQKRISLHLRDLNESSKQPIELIRIASNMISQCKSSILRTAFSGRLVPQDPSEGTGHELLAKIQASSISPEEKKAAPKAKRKKEKQ